MSGTTPGFIAANVEQREFVRSMRENRLTICRSRTFGTGKTYCAIGHACYRLRDEDSEIEKVVFLRDTVQANRKRGYMPGTSSEKLADLVKFAKVYAERFLGVKSLQPCHNFEFRDVASIDGDTYDDAFVIFDEASDADWETLQMVIGRIGQRSRCVILGTDRQSHHGAGFPRLFEKLPGIPEVGLIELRQVMRNDWVGRVLQAMDA